ncbi:MAG TPA: tetratricopeptide repeat protein [Deltaproteobacteria bacterium]|jgi:tetratricopeptide (TPR) repeat protein|nr:tetratricopeptide repeat protein [Deltaproteobacteria bacterium]
MALFLAVLVLGLYFNILDNKATNWDDPGLLEWLAAQTSMADAVKHVLVVHSVSTYQPVRDLTYLLDYALWGPGQNAVIFGMHLQSLVLYLLMVLACWIFLLELFKVFVDDESLAFVWAGLTATLFAVHPVHVESVAWIYGRKEPLLGIFTFLSMWAFIRARTASWRYYLASFAFLVLAILSKPTALVAPAAMLVLDLAIQARRPSPSFWKTRLIVYLPMLLVVVPMGIRLITMLDTAGGIKPLHGGSFWTNLLAVSQIFISYFLLVGFTLNYAADYPIQLFASPHVWQAWVFVGLNLALAGSAVAAFRKKHYLYAFFVAWFYIFLLPVSHIYPISQTLADRYALLPSLMWCVLLGYGFARLWIFRPAASRFSPEFPTLIAASVFSVLVVFYGFMTFHQNDVWKDAQSLWEDTLAKYPTSSPGNVNLSAIYLGQGRFKEVQELCITAIKQRPYDYLAISNLALAQMMMGQYDNAIHNYRQALALKPELPKSKLGLAFAYWLKKDYASSYAVYAEALEKGWGWGTSDYPLYHYRAGYAAWKSGKRDEAVKYLDRAMAMAPSKPLMYDDLGGVYTSMGELVKARSAFAEYAPLVSDEKTKVQLERVLELLDERISRQSPGAEAQAKP